MVLCQPVERFPLAAHQVYLQASHGAAVSGGAQTPPRLERIANAVDSTMTRGAKKRSQHPGKSMQMFVGIDMADRETTGLNSSNLGDGFRLNFPPSDAAAQQIIDKAAYGHAERGGIPWIEQRRHLARAEAR